MNTNVMNAYKQEPSVNSEPTQIPVTGSGKTSATSFVSQFDTSAASKKEQHTKSKSALMMSMFIMAKQKRSKELTLKFMKMK